MNLRRIVNLPVYLWAFVGLTLFSCNVTKNVPDGKYLLKSNTLHFKVDLPLTKKGELKSNIEKIIVQKPNSTFLGIPVKLIRYNTGYKKFSEDPQNYQIKNKTVEPPVIYDSTLKKRTALNIRSFLFNKGFFYATVTDTTILKNKRAYTTYNVDAGTNYLINKVTIDVDDKIAEKLVNESMDLTILAEGADFSYDLCEQEKSRITNLLRDYGFYNFTSDNVSFVLDTVNKQYFRDIENPFESAINFVAFQKNNKKPTLDINVVIRDNDGNAYKRYGIRRVRVMPDFQTGKDFRDPKMIQTTVDSVQFRYHNRYVHENVILQHMVVKPGRYYSQTEYDQTLSHMNDLGVFSSVRMSYRPDTTIDPYYGYWLNANLLMSPADKYNYNTSWELSNGTTYTAGTNLTLSLRNNNFGKGANLLTMSVTGGLESYFDSSDAPFFQHFKLLTKTVGANISLDLPKFLFPISHNKVSSANLPRTIVSVGANLLDRINYFRLLNVSTSFMYKWRETQTKTWEISPIFVNNITVSHITPTFQKRLDSNSFLRNTYSSTLIEGENIAFTYSDKEKKHSLNYNYLRAGVEEAGGLLKSIGSVLPLENVAQYLKFDLDAQHFFTYAHSTIATRFLVGVGIPYGKETSTLPYIKQYFVGGAYSLRGFRIRTLGPGSSYIPPSTIGTSVIDRTGDIKIEATTEYRFDIVKLFSGAIKMNGAAFADAGNIWLAEPSAGFPNGNFNFGYLGRDLAVDAGIGIRLDLSGFFIFRIDAAFPVKKPGGYFNSEEEATQNGYNFYGKGGWVLDKIDPASNDWRKKELVINFAIGYPF